MKIVFVGGSNNNNFAIVRYLRARGVEAHLRLFKSDPPHFHPACDTFSTGFMDYTETFDWSRPWVLAQSSRRQIYADLAQFDVVVGCGWLPAFAAAAGRPIDILVPHGSDIAQSSAYRFSAKNIGENIMIRYQRKGLRDVRVVHMSPTIPAYEQRIRTFMPAAERWLEGLPLIYHSEYDFAGGDQPSSRMPTHWSDVFNAARSSSDFLAVAHSRHYWSAPTSDPNHKGNDKYLRGWAQFLARNPKLKAKLVTCEYGPDVKQSKRLIADLGISDSIIWLPQLFRKDIMYGLHLCDAVIGEFTHSWSTGGVILESAVSAKPLITHRSDERLHGGRYFSVLNAYTPEQITTQLERCVEQKDECNAIGREAREWYQYCLVQPAIEKYLRFFGAEH